MVVEEVIQALHPVVADRMGHHLGVGEAIRRHLGLEEVGENLKVEESSYWEEVVKREVVKWVFAIRDKMVVEL